MTIQTAVIGAAGKMGVEMCRGILSDEELALVKAFDITGQGKDMGVLTGMGENGIKISDSFSYEGIDVVVDFTNAAAAGKNIPLFLKKGIHAVIGTTGFSPEKLEEFDTLAKENRVSVFIVPNFAVGAVLMMKFAREAAVYMPDVEIIELHHDKKLDAPSGTAVKTMEKIAEVRNTKKQGAEGEKEIIEGARGGEYSGMRVHSVRLPGLVAHQEVVFGSEGQLLTIRHDSFDRSSFAAGLSLAVKAGGSWNGLKTGLEEIL